MPRIESLVHPPRYEKVVHCYLDPAYSGGIVGSSWSREVSMGEWWEEVLQPIENIEQRTPEVAAVALLESLSMSMGTVWEHKGPFLKHLPMSPLLLKAAITFFQHPSSGWAISGLLVSLSEVGLHIFAKTEMPLEILYELVKMEIHYGQKMTWDSGGGRYQSSKVDRRRFPRTPPGSSFLEELRRKRQEFDKQK